MASGRARHWVGRLLMWVVLGTMLTGCTNATFKSDLSFGSRIGLRPDEPNIGVPTAAAGLTVCDKYEEYTRYALDLKESYRTRTTQNRTWIYVAGIMGLGVAAASGALAAATAVAAGTLALLAISGGAAAATFATIDNTQLANVYNAAANHIGTALATAEAQIVRNPADCATPLATLLVAVSEARNTLETARTDSAAGALARALAGQQAIKDIIAVQQDANLAQVVLHGEITAIKSTTSGLALLPVAPPASNVPPDRLITLTVTNARLESVPPTEIKIALGSKILDMANPLRRGAGTYVYEVDVLVPNTPPDGTKIYSPVVILGTSKQRIPGMAGLPTLVYL
jgi:hypothetical protein